MSTTDTASKIIKAARACLLADGYAAVSTRKVADEAGVPLSQIHYHFGSKDDLILGLLRAENEGLLERQAEMYGGDLPLSKQWEIACDYFDEDIASGYVRVLEETGLNLGGFSAEEVAALVSASFVGAESLILVGLEGEAVPLRAALRKVGDLIRIAEGGKQP